MNPGSSVIVEFHHRSGAVEEVCDLEIPLSISAEDLLNALNAAFDLGISSTDYSGRYLRCERPIALLKGSKSLETFGLQNGSILYAPRRSRKAGRL